MAFSFNSRFERTMQRKGRGDTAVCGLSEQASVPFADD